jgi:hypothetical protein
MEEKIVKRIDLFCEIYQKAYEKASKVNPDNARHMATEVFVQVARDLRSELISRLKREEYGRGKWKQRQARNQEPTAGAS